MPSADFDQNLKNITPDYPGKAPGSYTVKAGDTLTGIALQLWGDSSFWFLLAEANGLQSDNDLFAGQNLSIPNVVANSSNNAGTIQPYDPGAVIGDTCTGQGTKIPTTGKLIDRYKMITNFLKYRTTKSGIF